MQIVLKTRKVAWTIQTDKAKENKMQGHEIQPLIHLLKPLWDCLWPL